MLFAVWIASSALLMNFGCGGGSTPAPAAPPAALTVAIHASSMALGTSQNSNLTAIVSNDPADKGVTWSKPAGSPGSLTTVDSMHAVFDSGNVTQNGSVTITATSAADPQKAANLAITLSRTVAVVVSPTTSGLGSGETVAITASVANDSSNAGVSWSLSQGALGTLSQQSSTGATYTAPSTVSAASTETVTATALADSTKTATVTINLNPVSVTLSAPATPAVGPLETSRLTATAAFTNQGVTWTASAGTVTGLDGGCSSGSSCCPQGACDAIYLAPPDIAANTTVTITAALVSDPSKTATQTIALAAPATPDWEGLVAFDNGRDLGAITPWAQLEAGGKGSGAYQSSRMIFHEITAGPNSNGQPLDTEIWQLENVSPPVTAPGKWPSWNIPGTLNRTPWNYNGSYFELEGSICALEVFCHSISPTNSASSYLGDAHNYLFRSDGSSLQLIRPKAPNGAPELILASGGYLPWDKINPNLFYVVTDGSNNSPPDTTGSAVYSVDISNDFQMKLIATLPYPATDPVTGAPIRRSIQSYLSENELIMVTDNNPPQVTSGGSPDYIPNIYMVDGNPSNASFGTIEYQFPINFSGLVPPPASCYQVPVGQNNALCSGTPFSTNDEYHFHDIYFQRDAGDHFFFNFGPKGDVGEGVFWQASPDGKNVTLAYPNPLGTPYMSHPALNFSGTAISYGGADSVADQLSGHGGGNAMVRTVGPDNNLDDGTVVGNDSSLGVGHMGWDGYDPHYIVFDGYSTPTGQPNNQNHCGPTGDAMWSEMSADPTSMSGTFRVLVNDGLRNNEEIAGGCGTDTMPSIEAGPVQSPDATKMMFVKSHTLTGVVVNGVMVNTPSDAFVAVDHRPFPPSLSVAAGGSGLMLTITPNADHPHREVAGYHVYTSTDGTSFTEITSAAENTAPYGSIPVDSTIPITVPAPTGTAYYAVTAQEFSGLESNQLSNIVQVAGGSINNTFAAAGTTGWDTATPAPPTNFAACQLPAPQGSAGAVWKLTWTASTATNARYYNIYYSGGGIPPITSWQNAQNYLITSPAASQTSYIYWQANPKDVPAFGIVAVDRQDQASTPDFIQTGLTPQACSGS